MDLSVIMALEKGTPAYYIEHHFHISLFLQMVVIVVSMPIWLLAIVGFPGTFAGIFCYADLHWNLFVSIAVGLCVMSLWFVFLGLEA